MIIYRNQETCFLFLLQLVIHHDVFSLFFIILYFFFFTNKFHLDLKWVVYGVMVEVGALPPRLPLKVSSASVHAKESVHIQIILFT